MPTEANRYLKVPETAKRLGVSIPTVYAMVDRGVLPAPVYPTPSTPRFIEQEVEAALERTRTMPRDAKAARRNAKLASLVAQQAA